MCVKAILRNREREREIIRNRKWERENIREREREREREKKKIKDCQQLISIFCQKVKNKSF